MNKHILLCSFFLTLKTCHAETLTIKTKTGNVELDVEIARTQGELQKGLMYREQVPPKTGMLFLYEMPHILRMWMKNTYVPLDMLFVNPKGIILHIHSYAEPLSLKTIASPTQAKAVLEIGGGQAKTLNLCVGDRLYHPAFSAP